MSRLFAVLFLICFPILVQSQTLTGRGAERVYGSAFLGWQSVTVEGSSFDTRMANVGAGIWLWEGIALEGELGTSYVDDSISNLRVEMPSQVMLNLRLESPPTGGYAAFVQFGLARSEIDSRYTTNAANTSANKLSSSLSGLHFGLGMVLHFTPRFAVDAGYSRLIYEDDSGVNLFRFGVRFTPGQRR